MLIGMPQLPFVAELIDCLLPGRCALCGLYLRANNVCDGCRSELPWIERACPSCAAPVSAEQSDAVPCADCQRRVWPTRRVVAPLYYRFPVDALVKALKFQRQLYAAPALAELVLPALSSADIDADALVPVPLHRWRHGLRGFNQSHELARVISRATGIPVRPLVRRIRATKPQSGLGVDARRSNVRRAFRAVRRPACRHALVLDDVITTGETCRAIAHALLSAGVEKVSVLAVARAVNLEDGQDESADP